MKQMVMFSLLALYSGVIFAGTYINGSQLLKGCEDDAQNVMKFHCWGHIERAIHETGGTSWEGYPYCKPNEVTNKQLKIIVTTYLNEHSKDLHLLAYTLVQRAIFEAFPCPE